MINIKNIPKNFYVIITARLKNFKKNSNLSYLNITKNIVNEIFENLKPINIFVPTFCYDFLKKGYYDHRLSKPDIGRFSDEFFNVYHNNRSLDPVFNYSSIFPEKKVNRFWCKNAFGNESFFENMDDREFLVINLDLPTFSSTFIHYLENKFKVPYRFYKNFEGSISYKEKVFSSKYEYYVRDLNKSSIYNSKKIRSFLYEKAILKESSLFDNKIDWYLSSDLISNLSFELNKDLNFFVN